MSWRLLPIGEFQQYREQWQQLNLAGPASPLLDLDFVIPLLTEFSTGKEVLACHENGGRIDAMGILSRSRPGVWQTFQPSQAPLGAWLQRSDVEWDHLLPALRKKLPGFPLVVGITQQDPDLTPRPADSLHLRTQDYINTATITIKGTFEEYWNARGKNLRSNMKKQRTKLSKDGIHTRLQISRAPEEVAAGIADYGRLESAGWKADIGTAVGADNAQGRFYRSMLEAFCRRGAGSIFRYWFDDKLVAMNLCIEGHGSMIVLKTTYDESVDNAFSPAFLMREETCKLLFEGEAFERLEFYGKVMEWHLRWTSEQRTMYHVTDYRWPVLQDLRRLVGKSRNVEYPRSAAQAHTQSNQTQNTNVS